VIGNAAAPHGRQPCPGVVLRALQGRTEIGWSARFLLRPTTRGAMCHATQRSCSLSGTPIPSPKAGVSVCAKSGSWCFSHARPTMRSERPRQSGEPSNSTSTAAISYGLPESFSAWTLNPWIRARSGGSINDGRIQNSGRTKRFRRSQISTSSQIERQRRRRLTRRCRRRDGLEAFVANPQGALARLVAERQCARPTPQPWVSQGLARRVS
jgi:hypothetical protein